MTEHEEIVSDVPVAGIANQKVGSFFRDICIPDEEELREGDVGPEGRKSEHQLAHDMEMLRAGDVFEMTHALQPSADENNDGHRIQRGTRKEVDTPHR